MKISFARSRCECQARLVAKLDEQRHVLQAYAIDASGHQEPAPAHSIGAHRDRFDIGWLCSICGRNVLRSFNADALLWTEEAPSPASS
ncbi:MAG: hypothetical protein RMJ98_16940 [Myxococcales bacterium]|nr:hypothetical protein [Polyangiaceae bacterium]MDW8250983.1 hypothetical protein [Myxococcales bacterium]